MLSQVARILVIIGGLNWGLIGIGMLVNNGDMGWNVVHMLLGTIPMLEAVVYLLVGLGAVIMMLPRD